MANSVEYQGKILRINKSSSRVEYYHEGSHEWMDDGPAPKGSEDLFVKNGILCTRDDDGVLYQRNQYGAFSSAEKKSKKTVEEDDDNEKRKNGSLLGGLFGGASKKKSSSPSNGGFNSYDMGPVNVSTKKSRPLWIKILLGIWWIIKLPFKILWWIIKAIPG